MFALLSSPSHVERLLGIRDGERQQEISENRRLGYAVFNFDAASNKFTPDLTSHADCGNSCHVAVKAKDYIFHPYEKR